MGRIIAAVADERAVDEKPVDKEGALYAVDGAAPYAQMSVAPCCSVAALDISQGYVHAADKAHAPVYNAQLAVVAVVDLAGECRNLTGMKACTSIPALRIRSKNELGTFQQPTSS